MVRKSISARYMHRVRILAVVAWGLAWFDLAAEFIIWRDLTEAERARVGSGQRSFDDLPVVSAPLTRAVAAAMLAPLVYAVSEALERRRPASHAPPSR